MSLSFIMLSTSEAYGQGCPPVFRDAENARVFCTVGGGSSSCTPSSPLGLALADFTGIDPQTAKVDGWLDVAVVNSVDPGVPGMLGSVTLFRNTQDWPLNDPTKGLEYAQDPIPLDTSPLRVAFGRVNADVLVPAPDLIVMSRSKVYIFHYDSDLEAHYSNTPTLVLTPQFVLGSIVWA